MTDQETTVLPVIRVRVQDRARQLWAKFRRELAAVIETRELPAVLTAWWAQYRKAREYGRSARHRRRIFVTDPVTNRIRRERFVNQRTPQEQRTYSVFDSPDIWEESTTEIAQRLKRTTNNSRLILAGAAGPLEREG